MVLDENVHLLFTVVIIFFTCLIEALHFSFVEIIFQMLSLIVSLCYLYQMSTRDFVVLNTYRAKPSKLVFGL